jgi:AI-2 transport protein TqsA
MAASVEQRVTAAVVVVAAVAVGAYLGASVFAPLVLALFIIAVVWPLQQWLQARLPKLLALAPPWRSKPAGDLCNQFL